MGNYRLVFIAAVLAFASQTHGQQWSGNSNTTDPIGRTGNVGIGTTGTLDNKLHIADLGAARITFERTQSPARKFFVGTDNNPAGMYLPYDVTAGAARMFVTDSGNVGIGTTSPGFTFHVKKNIAGDYLATIENDNTTTGNGLLVKNNSTGGYDVFTVQNGSTNLIRIKDNGNVGIGATIPGAKLEVAGQVKITGGTPGAGKVLTSDAAGLATWQTPSGGSLPSGTNGQTLRHDGTNWIANGAIYNDGANVGIGTTYTGNRLNINGGVAIGQGYVDWSAPTNGMIIQGNVGIGTTSPGAKLDVAGDIRLAPGGLYTIRFEPGTVGSYTYAPFQMKYTGTYEMGFGSPGATSPFRFEFMTDLGSTRSQDAMIQVYGSANSDWSKHTTLTYNGASNYGALYTANGANLILNQNGGNVGIGTATVPRVVTNDANDRVIAIESGSSNRPSILELVGKDPQTGTGNHFGGISFVRNNGGSYQKGAEIRGWYSTAGSSDEGHLSFFTHEANTSMSAKMTILGNGSVGIGTTSPDAAYKLSVKGKIRAEEVVVETGWADFVFDPDYGLTPLAEVARHIQTHRHLPGIPTAAEVKANGVSLGAMQGKLLEKVEELTLYSISQQDEIQTLKAYVRALEGRLAAIEQKKH